MGLAICGHCPRVEIFTLVLGSFAMILFPGGENLQYSCLFPSTARGANGTPGKSSSDHGDGDGGDG